MKKPVKQSRSKHRVKDLEAKRSGIKGGVVTAINRALHPEGPPIKALGPQGPPIRQY